MAELSPYLNSHPNDLAFLRSDVEKVLKDTYGETAEIVFSVDNHVVYSSGVQDAKSIHRHHPRRNMHSRKRASIKGHINYTRFRNGFPVRVRIPIALIVRPSRNGSIQITIANGPNQILSAVRTGRAQVARIFKGSGTAGLRSKRSSSLRPSPEIINRPFLKTEEVMNSGTYTNSQTIMPILAYRRDWTGSRTPNFATLKKSQYPVNPHTVLISETLEDRYMNYQVSGIVIGDFHLQIRPFSDVYAVHAAGPGHLEQADAAAFNNLVNAGQLGIQANLAQSLAQYGQLTNMIANNAIAIGNSLRQLKRGNIPGAVSALSQAGKRGSRRSVLQGDPSPSRSLASNWLQLQYGWKPLLQDIQGLLQIIPNLSTGGFVKRVTGTGKARTEAEADYPPGDGNIGYNNTGKTTVKIVSSCKYVIRYRLDDPAAAFFAQTGFSNPINLAWEVLPFSFVFDWFLPVGKYLEGLHAFHGLTFLDGVKTQFTRQRWHSAISYSGSVVGVPQTTILRNAAFRRDWVSLTRTKLLAFPGPVAPSFNLNPFSNSGVGGNNRALNAIALLQQFRR